MLLKDRVVIRNGVRTLHEMRTAPAPASVEDLVELMKTENYQRTFQSIAIIAPASARQNQGTTWSVPFISMRGQIESLTIGEHEPLPLCFHWASVAE